MVKKKKIPMRKCIGCSEKKPKKEMIRIVRNAEGSVSIDLIGKVSGRGCYICNNIDCLNKAIEERRIQNALEVKIAEDIIIALKEIVLKNE